MGQCAVPLTKLLDRQLQGTGSGSWARITKTIKQGQARQRSEIVPQPRYVRRLKDYWILLIELIETLLSPGTL